MLVDPRRLIVASLLLLVQCVLPARPFLHLLPCYATYRPTYLTQAQDWAKAQAWILILRNIHLGLSVCRIDSSESTGTFQSTDSWAGTALRRSEIAVPG
jgi:hypothetical protein